MRIYPIKFQDLGFSPHVMLFYSRTKVESSGLWSGPASETEQFRGLFPDTGVFLHCVTVSSHSLDSNMVSYCFLTETEAVCKELPYTEPW